MSEQGLSRVQRSVMSIPVGVLKWWVHCRSLQIAVKYTCFWDRVRNVVTVVSGTNGCRLSSRQLYNVYVPFRITRANNTHVKWACVLDANFNKNITGSADNVIQLLAA